nr:MAG TPA: hypothetical protein [Caudoviricetes sp.]
MSVSCLFAVIYGVFSEIFHRPILIERLRLRFSQMRHSLLAKL